MEALLRCAAFIFDMDGLLLDTERLSSAALHAGAADLGLTLPSDIFMEMIGRRGPDIRARLADRVGAQDTADRLIERADEHYEAFLARGVPVKEGAAELLAWLESRGRPCAVATSTRTAKAERKLAAAGLRPFFRAVIGGDQVEHGKPAPDVYLRTAAALGVAPAHCAVFEDSDPGLRAAHAAGARVLWVPDLGPVSPATQALVHVHATSLRLVLQAFIVADS